MAVARDVGDPAQKLNVLREYLQACVLRSLHESEAFLRLAFVGGTALRFLFNLPRFSEDLDFSLHRGEGYEPVKWMTKVKRDLTLAGFDAELRWNDRKTVHTGWLKVGALLKESGLSDMAGQKLSIKLEVDTRPPEGAVSMTTLVNRHRVLSLRHYDLPSLMAGKVHALVTRKYPKGRDWYDLLWYEARRPPVEPNLVLLQNALDQTEGKGALQAGAWRGLARSRLEKLGDTTLREDARPFLEHPADAELLRKENLLNVLQGADATADRDDGGSEDARPVSR